MKARVPIRTSAEEEAKFRRQSERNNDRFLNYAHRSILLSVRDNAGFGDVRMCRLIDGSYTVGRDYIDRFGPHEKTDEDYAVDSYYAMRQELCYINWDPSARLWYTDNGKKSAGQAHRRRCACLRDKAITGAVLRWLLSWKGEAACHTNPNGRVLTQVAQTSVKNSTAKSTA